MLGKDYTTDIHLQAPISFLAGISTSSIFEYCQDFNTGIQAMLNLTI